MNQRDPTAVADPHSPMDVGAVLEAAGRGEMAMADLTIALAKHCRGNTDAVWETLALADQYFRRGRINADIFAAIKSGLHALVFPPPARALIVEQRQPSEQPADSDLPRETQPRKAIPAAAHVDPSPVAEASVRAVPAVERQVMPGAAEVRARADVNQRMQGASTSAGAPAKSAYRPPHYFREPNYSGETSATPKVLIGMGILVAVAIAIGYLFLTSQPAPPLHTATKSSQSPSEAPQAVVEPRSNDEDAAQLPAVVPATVPVPSVENVASVPDTTNSAPVSQPIATAPPLTTEARAQPIISFAVDPIVVEQGDSVARIVVHRSGSIRREWSGQWRTLEGSAKAERDFVATSNGVLLFSAGARDAVILVPIVKDSTRQHSDWFEVEVTIDSATATSASPNSSLRATVVIESAQAAGESESASPSADPPVITPGTTPVPHGVPGETTDTT